MSVTVIRQQQVVVASTPGEVATEPSDWVHHGQTTTPDLMRIFTAVLANFSEHATTLPPSGMTEEDVDALTEWLRGDSLDWEALERGDAWAD